MWCPGILLKWHSAHTCTCTYTGAAAAIPQHIQLFLMLLFRQDSGLAQTKAGSCQESCAETKVHRWWRWWCRGWDSCYEQEPMTVTVACYLPAILGSDWLFDVTDLLASICPITEFSTDCLRSWAQIHGIVLTETVTHSIQSLVDYLSCRLIKK